MLRDSKTMYIYIQYIQYSVLSYLSPPRKIRVRVRVRAIRAVRVAIALRIPLKTIARVYTHFTARSHNRRYCYDSPNNFWGVINRKVPNILHQVFGLSISSVVPLKSLDGRTTIRDAEGILKCWTEHFTNLFHEMSARPTLDDEKNSIKQIHWKSTWT